VTGASGYVGGRLVRELVAAGKRVRVLVRTPAKLEHNAWFPKVEITVGDAEDPDALDRALNGVTTAYYLLHSLQHGSDLETVELDMASGFAAAAKRAGVKRIVYLGGLVPDIPVHEMSPHMRSRMKVGEALRESGASVIELRASVIIGSGSASFEMLRYLTERLPAMITPRWVRTRTQPIAVRDVLRYLVHAETIPLDVSQAFDIGGPEVLTYQEMMQRYAQVAGLPPRIIVPINVLTPELSSHWVNLVTPVPRAIARPLVRSLRHPAVCHEHDIARYIPDPPSGLIPFDEAVGLALTRIKEANVNTRWSDASTPGAPSDPLPSDPVWTGGTLYTDVRAVSTTASPQQVFSAVERIGGETGWYSASILWRIRGFIDRIAGGVGLRRGRRDPEHLSVGDAVDFWRVEEVRPGQLVRLRAEMKMPGRAWLEFRIHEEYGRTTLTQRAIYWPKGLLGHAYWWLVAPFHAVVFPPMARHLVEHAEAVPLRPAALDSATTR
jgi:uncharacterized protein YbjT (DUF2867 family)